MSTMNRGFALVTENVIPGANSMILIQAAGACDPFRLGLRKYEQLRREFIFRLAQLCKAVASECPELFWHNLNWAIITSFSESRLVANHNVDNDIAQIVGLWSMSSRIRHG